MNQLTRKGKMRIGPVRNSNDVLVYDDHEKSATMNSFFATVGEKLASNFPTTPVDGLSLISRITPTRFFAVNLQNLILENPMGVMV